MSTRTPACWKWKPPTDADMDRLRRRWVREAPRCAARAGETEWRRLLMVTWQKERCGICGMRWPDQVIDHDHETGLIRGYLCRSCNTLEGNGDDGEDEFTRYRERNPASICGYRDYYWDPIAKRYARPKESEVLALPRPRSRQGTTAGDRGSEVGRAYPLWGVLKIGTEGEAPGRDARLARSGVTPSRLIPAYSPVEGLEPH